MWNFLAQKGNINAQKTHSLWSPRALLISGGSSNFQEDLIHYPTRTWYFNHHQWVSDPDGRSWVMDDDSHTIVFRDNLVVYNENSLQGRQI